MTTHGVTIDRQTGGVRPIDTIAGAAIGLLASCSLVSTEGKLLLMQSAKDVTDADDGTGTLTAAMNMIRKHSNAPVVVVAVDPSHVADAHGNASTFTLGFRLLQAESELGVRPAILAQNLVGHVEDDLISIGNKLGATVHLDGPNTNDAAAVSGVATHSSTRAEYHDPAIVDDSDNVVGASVAAAAIASTLNFWESASNKVVLGIKKLSRPISWAQGDATSQAQLLNDAKVGTIIRSNSGYRLWGGLTTGADAQLKFLCVTRTDDVIAKSIQEAFLWAVDMGITKTFVEDVLESVNAFLRDLKARGAIVDGRAWADKALNSPTSIALGNLYIDYDFTPVYPAYAITMRRHLTNQYLTQLFAA